MSPDHSQRDGQHPDEVKYPVGGIQNAPTTAPNAPASSTPVTSRDLFFGRLAVINGCIDQLTLDSAISQQQAGPARPLADILLENGSISEKERRAIELLCETHSARHGDDPQRSLASLTMGGTVSYRQPQGAGTVTYSPKSADGKPPLGTFGEYELLNEIARGGMGVVYKARQTKLNRVVALKTIRSGELADAEQVRRFYAEAEAAAKLDHVGIVPVYEVGQANGQHFFSMAFVAGKSLNDSVKNGGPLLPQQAARLMKTVAVAVQFAHDKGIVHRDIKPQNILLDEKDQPRVTDFGLAKQVEASSELTATGQIMGTPSYMPPEQAKGEIQEIGPCRTSTRWGQLCTSC
ncbi:MAG TPA: serine/threonine-protein kinase [Pirellulales bacterium]|nr:serine/threonine-protein kinase [Pirellulales bacterium]